MKLTKLTKLTKREDCSNGFTIVELMISTVIFSLVMVLCLTGMVQVSRAYYKGITHSKTQEAGRLLMEEISQTIQLSGSAISYADPSDKGPSVEITKVKDGAGMFCAGNKLYTYALDRKVVNGSSDESNKEIKNAIISEDVKCTDSISLTDDQLDKLNNEVTGTQKSILGENMRLTKFSITRMTPNAAVDVKAGNQLWKIDISIAYGDQDLFSTTLPEGQGDYIDDNNTERVICKSGTGAEFCSIVEMSTIVSRRIG